MLGQCVTPQQQTNVIKMSLSPKSARWSDLSIICGSQTFEAHKVMICSQVCCKFSTLDRSNLSLTVRVFRTSLRQHFLRGYHKHHRPIRRPLHAVQAMMIFLYGGQVEDERKDIDASDKLAFWVDLYTLADRAMIKRLITLAASKFQRDAELVWASHAFSNTCREIYSRLPVCTVAMRGAVCAVIVKHLAFLCNRRTLRLY